MSKVFPSHAIVLAAGLGTRMRAASDSLPKPLMPCAGKPLIDHVLDLLATAGSQSVVVNSHYLGDVLAAHVEDYAARHAELAIRLSPEEALAGATINAARALGIQSRVGTLEPGKKADIVLWDAAEPAELVYYMGRNPCRTVIKNGKVVRPA